MYILPSIAQENAETLLSKRVFLRKRKIIKCDLIYLPGYLFEVEVVMKRGDTLSEMVAVDGIRGRFAFVQGGAGTGVPEFFYRTAEIGVPLEEALEIARKEYGKHLLRRCLKTKVPAHMGKLTLKGLFHYPYWAGYFRRRGALDFLVIDALNGREQGPKMKPVFIELFLNKRNEEGSHERGRNV